MDNRCVVCDDVIPEGRMVCPKCEKEPSQKPECFIGLWNQLVICTQYEIFGDPAPLFQAMEEKVLKAKTACGITDRQFIVLMNGIREWKDILVRQYASAQKTCSIMEKGCV